MQSALIKAKDQCMKMLTAEEPQLRNRLISQMKVRFSKIPKSSKDPSNLTEATPHLINFKLRQINMPSQVKNIIHPNNMRRLPNSIKESQLKNIRILIKNLGLGNTNTKSLKMSSKITLMLKPVALKKTKAL